VSTAVFAIRSWQLPRLSGSTVHGLEEKALDLQPGLRLGFCDVTREFLRL
jgi:hypothetical protein